MPLDVTSETPQCYRCGVKYSRVKGFFPVCYSKLYKGRGYLSVCKSCVDSMYEEYLAECKDPKLAARQVCRRLDLYWSENVYNIASAKSATRSMMTSYIATANTRTTVGKDYDDTLREEKMLWSFDHKVVSPSDGSTDSEDKVEEEASATPDDIVALWGKGYTDDMYAELEQRWAYWIAKFPAGIELDIGTEALIRQICSLELDIKRDRIAGKSVDKSVTALNTLLGSANLKPSQQAGAGDSSIDGTPFGVWINRFENKRPVPEPDPELEDVDGLIRYYTTWVLGHLAKMVGVKNSHVTLYEKEMEKLRVEHPEFEDEDDEDLLYDVFGSTDEEEAEVE